MGRLGEALGRRLSLDASWGELVISEKDADIDLRLPATPLAVDMGMVGAAETIVDALRAGRLGAGDALLELDSVARRPMVSLARLAIMAGLGAAALSVIFGAPDALTIGVVAASASAGAGLRRVVSRVSDNVFTQPFLAALLAGALAAAAAALRWPVALSLVAVCPCMILVPGPHFLNGMLDLARARIPLGAARLALASLIVGAICAGLLIGLSPEMAILPEGGTAAHVPILGDVLAAGLAVAAYTSFFNMPWRAVPVPIVVGMMAHALRWELLAHGATVQTGAFAACLLVGTVMTPLAHRTRLPFSGLAFASVVSLIPGVLMFRTASNALALVDGRPASLVTTAAVLGDAATSSVILFAMASGLIVPKMLIDRVTALRNTR